MCISPSFRFFNPHGVHSGNYGYIHSGNPQAPCLCCRLTDLRFRISEIHFYPDLGDLFYYSGIFVWSGQSPFQPGTTHRNVQRRAIVVTGYGD